MTEPIVYLFSSDTAPEDMGKFKAFAKRISKGTREDFLLTNRHFLGKSSKFGAGLLASSYFTKETGTLTPLSWVINRFGPLPLEFTKSGTLQIFTLTAFQRLKSIAAVTAIKFVYVTIAFETGKEKG